MYSSNQSDPPRSSSDRDVSHEHMRRKEIQKYLRESCYHRIKCTTATFLAAFMWRRPLNSAALATATHRKPKRVSNGIGTQVRTQMINKCRIRMVQKELYNVRDPPLEGDLKNRERTLQQSKLSLYPIVINLYECDLLRLKVHWYQNLLFVFNCHLIQYQPLSNSLGPSSLTHSLQIYCIGLIGPRSHTSWAWAVNQVSTVTMIYNNETNHSLSLSLSLSLSHIYIYIYIYIIYYI